MIIGLNGCVTPETKTASELAPIDVPSGEETRAIAFRKIVLKVPRHKPIGKYAQGLLCVPRGDLRLRGGRYRLDTDIFNDVFIEEMEAANYRVVGDPDALFEDRSLAEAEFFIAGLIENIEASVCYPRGGMGNWDDSTASVYMEIAWQVWSTLDRKVVFKAHADGSAAVEEVTDGALDIAMENAFAMSLRNLLADEGFHSLMTTEPSFAKSYVGELLPLNLVQPAEQGHFDATRIRPGIVTVRTALGHGSGFFISEDGYLLTSEHVVGSAKNVRIVLHSGREVPGEVLRADSRRDIALLKVGEKGTPGLPLAVRLPKVGKEVFAYGTPLAEELEGTLTRGIVSGYRTQRGLKVIQSDVTIAPGSSGGPLLDDHGNVVGVAVSGHVLKGGFTGHNFFVPINEALDALMVSAIGS